MCVCVQKYRQNEEGKGKNGSIGWEMRVIEQRSGDLCPDHDSSLFHLHYLLSSLQKGKVKTNKICESELLLLPCLSCARPAA